MEHKSRMPYQVMDVPFYLQFFYSSFWNFEFVLVSVVHVGVDGTRTPIRQPVVGVKKNESRIKEPSV